MKPYYKDTLAEIWFADCEAILHTFDFSNQRVVLITDPPYGVNERTDRKKAGRSALAECNDFPPIHGDDKPFDPTPLLSRFERAILFGANHYANLLPSSPSWIVWDKRDGMVSNDNADCEMAWTNLGGPARLYRHVWYGMIKGSERRVRRVHPTQKPVALFQWIIDRYTLPSDLIVDPYMGSGSVLRAAKSMGRQSIGIEIEERYCQIAAGRLVQESFLFRDEE